MHYMQVFFKKLFQERDERLFNESLPPFADEILAEEEQRPDISEQEFDELLSNPGK